MAPAPATPTRRAARFRAPSLRVAAVALLLAALRARAQLPAGSAVANESIAWAREELSAQLALDPETGAAVAGTLGGNTPPPLDGAGPSAAAVSAVLGGVATRSTTTFNDSPAVQSATAAFGAGRTAAQVAAAVQGSVLSVTQFEEDNAQYVLQPPVAGTYTQSVIFDPCRGAAFNCCNDTYGVPEFAPPAGAVFETSLDASGAPMPVSALRRPADALLVDESCTAPGVPRADCVTDRVSRVRSAAMPACWNYNDSLVADAGCLSPADGTPLPTCVALGFSQNTYIVECSLGPDPSARASHRGCGTFLEVHVSSSLATSSEVLASVRLPSVLTSGYRMTVLTLRYKESLSQTLCYNPATGGAYELWWVVRTPSAYIVESRSPFAIVSPLCDWDATYNRWQPYASLEGAPLRAAAAAQLVGVDPFRPATRVYTQTRTEGTPAAPGVGMGSTLVPIVGLADADAEHPPTYPPLARWAMGWGPPGRAPAVPPWRGAPGDNYTYRYTPLPVYDFSGEAAAAMPPNSSDTSYPYTYSVAAGVIEPTLAQQQALADVVAARGYRRLRAQGAHEDADALLAQATHAALAVWWGKGELYGGGSGGGDGGGVAADGQVGPAAQGGGAPGERRTLAASATAPFRFTAAELDALLRV